jgi:hypothetical protein
MQESVILSERGVLHIMAFWPQMSFKINKK